MELVPSPLTAHLSLPRTVLGYNYMILCSPFLSIRREYFEPDRDSESFNKCLTEFLKNIDE